jgi:hypothetical protein
MLETNEWCDCLLVTRLGGHDTPRRSALEWKSPHPGWILEMTIRTLQEGGTEAEAEWVNH